jgi:spore germination cell wall hydrolase CwlJ-like protein
LPHTLLGMLLVVVLLSGLAWGTGLLRYLGVGIAQASTSVSYQLPPAVEQDLLASTQGELATRVVEGEAALKINASLPFVSAPLEAAAPFSLGPAAGSNKDMALLCLTQAIYYEAGYEPVEGRRAVAQVILNRMRHPAFPKTVCGVVYQGSSRPGCQFSFTCDGSLRRAPQAATWNAARRLAEEALAGHVAAEVGEATHYHANYVAPYWAPKLAKLTQIGAHIFYRWPGVWGRKGAFTGQYAGGEFIPRNTLDPTTATTQVAESAAMPPQAPDDHHAPNDIGGRLDVTKGWTLNIPAPTESGGSLARALASQGQTVPAAAAAPVVALNDSPKDALQ